MGRIVLFQFDIPAWILCGQRPLQRDNSYWISASVVYGVK